MSAQTAKTAPVRKALPPSLPCCTQVNDLVALRIVIHPQADHADENEQATLCYHALGKIHGLWTPLPRTLKDYISSPKPNGYRSLHTTVLVGAQPLEIQIRTQEMHLVAEFGAAAHWAYKENGGARASLPWLQLTVRKWRDLDCAHEFMQLVRQVLHDAVTPVTPVTSATCVTPCSWSGRRFMTPLHPLHPLHPYIMQLVRQVRTPAGLPRAPTPSRLPYSRSPYSYSRSPYPNSCSFAPHACRRAHAGATPRAR